jgi:hypothetical protein
LRIGVLIAIAMGLTTAGNAGQEAASPAFGTTNTTYYRMGTTNFRAYSGVDDTYFDDGISLWPTSGTGWFNATPYLPTGALLSYLELDYCDTNTQDLHLRLDFLSCDPVSVNGNCNLPGLGYVISSSQPANAPCASASVALNHTVANATEQLILSVHFGAFDYTNRLRSVVVGYKLQVSPAPATATFNDVPTSDVGFQFVEALAAAGITGGCGGGNYCPDSPVTRRQIAIMLAKALGLSFNN